MKTRWDMLTNVMNVVWCHQLHWVNNRFRSLSISDWIVLLKKIQWYLSKCYWWIMMNFSIWQDCQVVNNFEALMKNLCVAFRLSSKKIPMELLYGESQKVIHANLCKHCHDTCEAARAWRSVINHSQEWDVPHPTIKMVMVMVMVMVMMKHHHHHHHHYHHHSESPQREIHTQWSQSQLCTKMVRLSGCLNKPNRHPNSHSRFVCGFTFIYFFYIRNLHFTHGGLLICTARIGTALCQSPTPGSPFTNVD